MEGGKKILAFFPLFRIQTVLSYYKRTAVELATSVTGSERSDRKSSYPPPKPQCIGLRKISPFDNTIFATLYS